MAFKMGVFKNLIFGVAIFILTIFVGVYGISTLYGESPQYDKYCPGNLINASVCMSNGGTWANNTQLVADSYGTVKPVPIGGGYCQYDYTGCQKELSNAEEKYSRKIFFTALPLGIAVIFAGAMIFGLEVVGAGLMAGGVGLIIYGAENYWRFADDWLKFSISLIGLIALIGFAYWFNKNNWNIWKRRKR